MRIAAARSVSGAREEIRTVQSQPVDQGGGGTVWRGRREAVVHHDFEMSQFQFLEFLLLLGVNCGAISRFDSSIDAAHTFRGLDPDRFEFRRRRIDDGRDFGCLLGRQIQGTPQMLAHPIAHVAGMRWPQEMAPFYMMRARVIHPSSRRRRRRAGTRRPASISTRCSLRKLRLDRGIRDRVFVRLGSVRARSSLNCR